MTRAEHRDSIPEPLRCRSCDGWGVTEGCLQGHGCCDCRKWTVVCEDCGNTGVRTCDQCQAEPATEHDGLIASCEQCARRSEMTADYWMADELQAETARRLAACQAAMTEVWT